MATKTQKAPKTRQLNQTLAQMTDTRKLKKAGFIPMSMWGKDHWSLLGYVGCRVADNQGILNYSQMRMNPATSPNAGAGREWNPGWGTRLKGFWINKTDTNPALRLNDHDDLACLYDLEAEGLIVTGTFISGYVGLTDKGNKVLAALTEFKNNGGHFSQFEYPPKPFK